MTVDPIFLAAIGDVFLNLAAGWFGATIIIPGTYPRGERAEIIFIIANVLAGVASLARGYQLRILGA